MRDGPARTRASVRRREQRHRRVVLLSIGALLVLAMSPLFGHHLAHRTDALFAGRDHLGALCLIALHYLAAPVHRAFHLLLFGGLAYAVWSRLRAWISVRRTLSLLSASEPGIGSATRAAALSAGLPPARVRVVAGLPVPAFTVGWLRPRVYVAGELEERLGAEELVAVLAHERAHAQRRDPLRISALRFVSHTLFWLPALRRLADDFADEAEIRADDAAAAGRPLVLASAILTLARWGQPRPLSGGVGFDERDLLERRVRRLAGEETLPRSHVTRRSVAGACAALLVVWITGTAVAHPLPEPASEHSQHCDHPEVPALLHLLCKRQPLPTAGPCPHLPRG